MTARRCLPVILSTCAIAAAGCGGSVVEPHGKSDLILRGGRIYTRAVRLGGAPARADGAKTVEGPVVAGATWLVGGTALAVLDGRIVHVGEDRSVERFRGVRTEVVELDGAAVFPGLVDAHGHVLGLGRTLRDVDVVGTSSAAEVAARVAARAARLPAGRWIIGRGWDQNDWAETSFPSRDLLDRAAPGHPVFLERIDGHAAWVNSRALEAAGIGTGTADPPGGRIVRHPSTGEPTGVLVDRAVALVESLLPEPSVQERMEMLDSAMARMLQAGLTGVHDAGIDAPTLEAYRRLASNNGGLPLRVYAMIDGRGPLLETTLERGPEIGSAGGFLTVRCVKLVADGALGSRGAALLEDYADDPGNRGHEILSGAEIERTTEACLNAGLQVATHAIGDAANRTVLDAYERALSRMAPRDGPKPRLRIEHAQIVAPPDLPRFAQLGVIASMQPTHATSDMPWAPDRLGPDRLAGAYAWRDLMALGALIASGSDFPVESHRPLLGIAAAVTRQDADGHPPGGWLAEQRMTVGEALASFTLAPAWAAFEEDRRGRLEPGFDADMTILSPDPLGVAPADIPAVEVVYTIVAGSIRYSKTSRLQFQDVMPDDGAGGP